MKLNLSFLLAGICLLLLPACTESGLTDNDGEWPGVNLSPGEQAVMFTLESAGHGAVPATRAADEVTLPGETDIEKLDIYCFAADATTAAAADFTLEHVYRYSKTGTANDFLLIASATGYKLGIGVPQDDKLRRFLIIANDAATRTATVTTTTYADVLVWRTAAITGDVTTSLSSPFPMTSRVPKPVLMNDGSYTYKDEPFSAADLVKGVNVKLQRRVARLDIGNPVSDYFEVIGIHVTGYADYGLFEGTKATTDTNVSYGLKACGNAASIPGAFYCYPGGASSSGTVVAVSGNYLGVATTVTATGTQLSPNTRYMVRIHDSNHNLNATLEVQPWDEGGDIEAPVGETYATVVNVSVPSVGSFNPRSYAYIDKTNHIIWLTQGCLSNNMLSRSIVLTSAPFLQLKGAEGNTAPVGIILSDALKGRVEANYDSTTGITQLKLIPTEEENANPSLLEEKTVSAPASVTFVTQPDGTGTEPKYEEWTLIEDFLNYSNGALDLPSSFPTLDLRSTQSTELAPIAAEEGVTVTLSPYINDSGVMLTPEAELGNCIYSFYIEKGGEWLGRMQMTKSMGGMYSNTPSHLVYPTRDNDTGEAREAVLVVRKSVDDNDGEMSTGGIEERRYRIIQPPITEQTQAGLAAGVEVVLEAYHPAKELRMEENTIYMDYGEYNEDSGGGGGGILQRMRSNALSPFSLFAEGRKPVRVFIPSDCNWLAVSEKHDNVIYINPSDNFIRQFTVEPNKDEYSRSVRFTVQTYVNGKVKDTVYELVQAPTKKGSGGGLLD